MREKPLDSWIIAEPDGKVLAAHCTCMAGLGEACTHIAALLFSIDDIVQVRDNKTVTQEKAYWLLPTSVKGVEYKECREIDFSSAKSLKRKLDNRINSTGKMECASTSTARTSSRIPKPTREEADQLFKSLLFFRPDALPDVKHMRGIQYQLVLNIISWIKINKYTCTHYYINTII